MGIQRYWSLEEKFWSRVLLSDGCWEWDGTTNPEGYGGITRNGQKIGAHRVSWELENGPIPRGMKVLHKCDNPKCVRPGHLFLGTTFDNNRDRSLKGRSASGERGGLAKLTRNQVAAIRERYQSEGTTQQKLAREFGVCPASIHNIVTEKTWRLV